MKLTLRQYLFSKLNTIFNGPHIKMGPSNFVNIAIHAANFASYDDKLCQ